MRLVIAVIHTKDADPCVEALNNGGFACTRLASFGGFLDRDNVTLLIGVEEDHVDEVIELIRSRAKPRNERLEAAPLLAPIGAMATPLVDVEVGGATIFVIDVERFVKL